MARAADGPPIVGVDLGGTKILAGVVGGDQKIMGRAKRTTPAKDGGPAILAAVISCVDEALAAAGMSREPRSRPRASAARVRSTSMPASSSSVPT